MAATRATTPLATIIRADNKHEAVPPVSARFTRSQLFWASAMLLAGTVTALLGIYWDEAWHTDVGRDTFWSAPHLLMYGGVGLVGLVTALWAWLTYRQEGGLRATLRQGPLALALIGVAATLLSAPIDDFWHEAFGRDSIAWSPPHMLGLVGILALAGGVLLGASSLPGRPGRRLAVLASAAVLATMMVLPFEYDADVPQFAVLWYLPVLSGAAALAFSLGRRVVEDRWLATRAALLYTTLMALVVLALDAMGHSLPIIPAIALPALVFDLAARRGWPTWLRAAVFSGTVYASYVPYLWLTGHGVRPELSDVVAGLPLAWLASWAATAALFAERPGFSRRVLSGTSLLLATLVFVTPILAHDPGQGDEVGQARLGVVAVEAVAAIEVELVGVDDCAAVQPHRTTARRAGMTLHGTLEQNGPCRYRGAIDLPDRGRWFVYAELSQDGEPLETWIPVVVSDTPAEAQRLASLYVPSQQQDGFLTTAAGLLLYALELAILALMVVLFRNSTASQRVQQIPSSPQTRTGG